MGAKLSQIERRRKCIDFDEAQSIPGSVSMERGDESKLPSAQCFQA